MQSDLTTASYLSSGRSSLLFQSHIRPTLHNIQNEEDDDIKAENAKSSCPYIFPIEITLVLSSPNWLTTRTATRRPGSYRIGSLRKE